MTAIITVTDPPQPVTGERYGPGDVRLGHIPVTPDPIAVAIAAMAQAFAGLADTMKAAAEPFGQAFKAINAKQDRPPWAGDISTQHRRKKMR